MASEIIVQNLKGPASGSNANKIIVPSGHTLDASEGFTPPSGHVVQVQSYKMPVGPVASSGNNTWLATGCNVSITPTSASSKVLVILSASTLANATASYAVRVQRNGTVINLHEMYNNSSGPWQGDSVSLVCLDSPATTSSVSYTVDMLAQTGSTSQMRFNYNNGHGSTSTITAMEITG